MHYLELLRRLHDELRPAGYLEIGVDVGDSLGLSRARSVAIDPAPKPRAESLLGKPGLLLYIGTSDDFFREHQRETMLRDAPLDLAFIDGLHEFAQVVRDLEHVERWGHAGTVAAIHDVLPRNAWEAAQAFHDGFWTGDVWRLGPFLQRHRPDLRLWLTQADPTGMLIVTGFDPAHPGMAQLAESEDATFPPAGPEYDRQVEGFIAAAHPEPAEAVISAVGLRRRLARDWDYQMKWGMRHVAESSWRPLLDAAAALSHTAQHRDGLRACLRLIGAYWLPEGVREHAYGCMAEYAEPLADLWPMASLHPLAIPGETSLLPRSPSPAAMGEKLVVAIQTPARGEADWALCDLDRDLGPRAVTPLREETAADAAVAIAPSAIEQMHLIVHDRRLHVLATVSDRNPRGAAHAVLATVQGDALRDARLLSDAANGRPERHWAPFLTDDGLHAISCWEPTESRRIDAGDGGSSRAALRPAPRLAERFQGASAGVSVPGGWLFLVNEPAGASGDGPLVFARFVFLRADFVVTAVSPHFWVQSRGEDEASGLTRLGDELIPGFTAGGRQAMVARIPVVAVMSSLLPIAGAGVGTLDPRTR